MLRLRLLAPALAAALLVSAASAAAADAPVVERVAVLNPATEDADPRAFAAWDGAVAFAARDGLAGEELWRTTEAGAVRVGDLAPGLDDLSPGELTAIDETLYFTAHEQLWKSDGTAAGTVPVAPGKAFDPRELVAHGQTLFFVAGHDDQRELWQSDGTPAGTVVVPLRDDGVSPEPQELTVAGTTLFFAADDGEHGRELYARQGSPGAVPVRLDINVTGGGAGHAAPHELTAIDDWLYFAADDGVNGMELWRSGGTPGTTELRADVAGGHGDGAGSWPSGMVRAGARIYFAAEDGDVGREVFLLDGDAIHDTDVAPGLTSSDPRSLAAVGGRVVFVADPASGGPRLYAAEGDTVTELPGGEHPEDLTATGTHAVFSAFAGAERELWTTDGTVAGTATVGDAAPSDPTNLTRVGDAVYLAGHDAEHGVEPWRTDGTAAGTALVADVDPLRHGDEVDGGFLRLGSRLVFAADDGTGSELWLTDGTAAGTIRPKDTYAGMQPGVQWSATVGDLVFFLNHDDALWRTDGTADGTIRLVQAIDGVPVRLGDELYFGGPDAELWSTDGTVAGTGARTALGPLGFGHVFVSGSRVVFTVALGGGPQLHVHTPGGDTAPLPTAEGGAVVPDVGPSVVAGGDAFFVAAGSDLWRTDGTQARTELVVTVSGFVTPVAAVGGQAFFIVAGGDDDGLWVSDGTAAGTHRLAAGRVWDAGVVGELVFFAHDDGEHGQELWQTDGTQAGTRLTADLRPGPDGAEPNAVAGTPAGLVAAGTDADGRERLFLVTAGGATPIAGTDGDDVDGVLAIGRDVYFALRKDAWTNDLWRVRFPAPDDGPDDGPDDEPDDRPGGERPGGGGGPAPAPPAPEVAPVARPGSATAPRLGIRSLRVDRRTGVITARLRVPAAGRITAGGGGLRPVRRTVRAGALRLTLRPGRRLARTLARRGRAQVRLRFGYAPAGARPSSVSRVLTLRARTRG